jgi:hypothetical protein
MSEAERRANAHRWVPLAAVGAKFPQRAAIALISLPRKACRTSAKYLQILPRPSTSVKKGGAEVEVQGI